MQKYLTEHDMFHQQYLKKYINYLKEQLHSLGLLKIWIFTNTKENIKILMKSKMFWES